MGHSETSFNRKKINYLARRREKVRSKKRTQMPATIDSKKARHIRLEARREKWLENKKEQKAIKMEVDKE